MPWIRVGQWEIVVHVEPTGLTNTPLPDMRLCFCPERVGVHSNSDFVIRSVGIRYDERTISSAALALEMSQVPATSLSPSFLIVELGHPEHFAS